MGLQRVPRSCQFELRNYRRLPIRKRWVAARTCCQLGCVVEAMLARGGAFAGNLPGCRSSSSKMRQ
eukprot:9495290-Karenia_brevis.AAC.1